jgi:hypothetical protein
MATDSDMRSLQVATRQSSGDCFTFAFATTHWMNVYLFLLFTIIHCTLIFAFLMISPYALSSSSIVLANFSLASKST